MQALDLFKLAGMVHCDLKAENILVDLDPETKSLRGVKLIDMGQSFLFNHINEDIIVTTPEYLPPEVLENTASHTCSYDFVNKLSTWSIDVWSLGAVLLEVIMGFPIWLSYRGRIVCEIINDSG